MGNKKNITFLSEFSNLLFFWFLGVIYFFVFRLSFIFIYCSDINTNLKLIDYVNAFFMGFRYDIIVISDFLIIPFLSIYILIPLKKGNITIKIRKTFQVIFAISSVIISLVSLNYYSEYNDQFNHYLFMGLHDDLQAVLQTILSDFHPIKNILIIVFLIILFLKTFKHFEYKNRIYLFLNTFKFKFSNIFFKILALILFVGGFRASYTGYPVRRAYAAVSPDHFINKVIINPLKALNYAILDYNELNKKNSANPFNEIPVSIKDKYSSINNFLKKETTAILLSKEKPNQIFLIIMESYDSWPLMDKYTDLKLTPELKNIENKGVRFTNFLPAAYSTFNSSATIITSIPYNGVNISKIGANRSFPTSIFKQFKKLGYETNYFYGGFLSWQNLQNFVKKQGADNLYGAPDSEEDKVIWGVIDEFLFDMVLKKVDTKTKSLNIILTTSHHSPYEVDIYKKGFFYKTKNDIPTKYQKIYNQENTSLKHLGHLWYSDKSLGSFVKKAEKKYSNSLFAITGDHFGRKFINTNPTLYESSSVPFILYGNYVKGLPKKIETPGSHKDISATLLDLVAPNNFSYSSFGNSLFKNQKKAIGIGYNKLITKNILIEYTKNYGKKKYILPSKTKKNNPIEKNHKEKLDSVMSLSWHYIIKGDSIY